MKVLVQTGWCKSFTHFWGRYGDIFSYGEFFGILRSQYLGILCYSQLAQYSFLCLTHKEVSLAAGCFHYPLQEELPRPRVSFAVFVSHHRFAWPGGLPRFGKLFSQKTIFLGLSVKQNSWHRPLLATSYKRLVRRRSRTSELTTNNQWWLIWLILLSFRPPRKQRRGICWTIFALALLLQFRMCCYREASSIDLWDFA